MSIECAGFIFITNFDSANIDRVELVSIQENEDGPENHKNNHSYEFNLWTRPDCAGTEYVNNNRTWFYFGVTGGTPCSLVKFNVLNLNKQGKLFSHGMAPVYKTIPGPIRWERVRDRLSFDFKNNLLSFGYRTSENLRSTAYFAFTYPFSFSDLQKSFKDYELQLKNMNINSNPLEAQLDDIYYHRECLIRSLEERPVDLITITSHHGITNTEEPRLKGLFPDMSTPRSFKFTNKKIIFLSARVHPGETPSSFVMNGVLCALLNKNDSVAILLRKLFVFKLIPMLNPDGVSRGFYRTDTRGVNLNRYYLNPSLTLHPSVYAARALILFYHYGFEAEPRDIEDVVDIVEDEKTVGDVTIDITEDTLDGILQGVSQFSADVSDSVITNSNDVKTSVTSVISDTDIDLSNKVAEISVVERDTNFAEPIKSNDDRNVMNMYSKCSSLSPSLPKSQPSTSKETSRRKRLQKIGLSNLDKCNPDDHKSTSDSGLYLYIDFHGHASKKGIFMFGNHFDNMNDIVDCLLLPKLLSINNTNFHYSQCNFSKRNMCTKDRRDGLSKAGSGRVAVLKYTGLVKSYTLECNYNSGCIVNILPPTQRPLLKSMLTPIHIPPKYTPLIFEEFGRALCVSILDLFEENPNSRIPASNFKSLHGLQEFIRGETLIARSIEKSQNLKVNHNMSFLQKGNKSIKKKNAVKRKILKLKRSSKNSLFSELPSHSLDKKESNSSNPSLTSKSIRPSSSSTIMHPLNKCTISTSAIGLLKKHSKTKKMLKKKKEMLLKKKMFETYKVDKEIRQNRGEFSGWSSNKRKVEKFSRAGNANPSVRPLNKKHRKSKIL